LPADYKAGVNACRFILRLELMPADYKTGVNVADLF